MAKYSIKDLETLTGVKAHTIRIWEQRYNLLVPDRTETNIRSYSDGELKKLLQANVLYSNGYKISKIAAFSQKQILAEIETLSNKDNSNNVSIEALTIAMIEMNEQAFEEVLNSKIEKQGLDKTMSDIIYPFLDRIGVLWVTGVIEPAQEHFMSNLIRQKIIVAINNTPICDEDNMPTCIAFLHQEEMHELGLLYYTYHLRLAGYKTIYLGQMTPYADVLKTSVISKPNLVLTSFVKVVEQKWFDQYVEKLASDFSFCNVIISGIGASKSKVDQKNLYKVSSAEHMIEVLAHLEVE
jgi:DNA-binding transcriptional MerR regulator